MGIYFQPQGITEEQSEAFLSEGMQVDGSCTASNFQQTLDAAGIDYGGDIWYCPQGGVEATQERVEALDAAAKTLRLQMANGVSMFPQIIANCFRAARMMGVPVTWG